jgi:hypothetical protein
MNRIYKVCYKPNISSQSEILIRLNVESYTEDVVTALYDIKDCLEVIVNEEDKKVIKGLMNQQVEYLDL